MTLHSDIFPDEVLLIARKWFLTPGQFNYTVVAGAKFARISVIGVGGQGDAWGGGGAFVRSRVTVTPGENLKVQVGDTSTASTPGDSYVRRNDNTNIAYADRGRGNGSAGLAANSIGDVKRDGSPAVSNGGGAPASDLSDYGSLFFGGLACKADFSAIADCGGGGQNYPVYDDNGNFILYSGWGGGPGRVCIELWDGDPGY